MISTYRSAIVHWLFIFFFQAEDGIRDLTVTGVQTCALPISEGRGAATVGGEGTTSGHGSANQHCRGPKPRRCDKTGRHSRYVGGLVSPQDSQSAHSRVERQAGTAFAIWKNTPVSTRPDI